MLPAVLGELGSGQRLVRDWMKEATAFDEEDMPNAVSGLSR